MFDFTNLNYQEFEILCKDIMSKQLGVPLTMSPAGADGGIDLFYKSKEKYIVVQVKHYKDKNRLVTVLKNTETAKVQELAPKEYYICCSTLLTPNDRKKVYELFSEYMESSSNIFSLKELDDLLQQENYSEIVRKNYKLWLAASKILSELYNNDIFIDCESLLSNIEQEKNFFVATHNYHDALNYLKKNNVIMLLGDPGVGKTTLSKMLILYFAVKNYRIRFTTDVTNIAELKKAISTNSDYKEVILLDDCFGQYYFAMKTSQENELLTLIRYIKSHPNKKLILNSRITIYNEAIARNDDFRKSIGNKELNAYYIHMNKINPFDKARILYNHLYFYQVEDEYWHEIINDKAYMKIVKHDNYNPRLVEYICNQAKGKNVSSINYLKFITETLDNPQEVWKNEYERRLQKEDKILLNILFSLSNTEVEEHLLKKAFLSRIRLENDLDTTNDIFNQCLARLNNNLIKQVDKNNKKCLSVANPSINDFLSNYLRNNELECDKITNSATHINQIIRLLDKEEFNKKIIIMLEDKSIERLDFISDLQKQGLIVYYLMLNNLEIDYYKKYIQAFLLHPVSVHFYDERLLLEKILKTIFTSNAFSFYQLKNYLKENLEKTFEQVEFYDLSSLINLLFSRYKDDEFCSILLTIANQNIDGNFYSVDAVNYESDVDLDKIIRDTMCQIEDYDYSNAAAQLDKEIQNLVQAEIELGICDLPEEILIKLNNFSSYPIKINDSKNIIKAYIDETDYEPELDDNRPYDKEIHSLFNKHPF